MHGTVAAGYGSPEIDRLLLEVSNYHLPLLDDGLVMGIPETPDLALLEKLNVLAMIEPSHVTLIGYSFANAGGVAFDDHISLRFFLEARRKSSAPILIVEPRPHELQSMLSDALQSREVYAVPAYWNVLAHAFMRKMRGDFERRSLGYVHEMLLDKHGEARAFWDNAHESHI
jgi:hypothetical protein